MGRFIDLTGQVFGRLTVIERDKSVDSDKGAYWICQCECGNIVSVKSYSLRSGATKSCGCLKRKQDKINLTKHYRHMMSGTRIYQEWQGMKGRCNNPHDPRYDRWGGRGIKVCDEWQNSFEAFYNWAMANGYKDDLTIDRIDNDGNYEPSNCRWATQQEQSRNRSSNIKITIGNSTRTLMEWCSIFNVNYKNVRDRYWRNGFSSIDDLFNRG